MNKHNKTKAIIVGILILVAYSMLAGEATDIKWVVTLLDVISGLAVIGIAVIMYPFFKVINKVFSQAYLVLRFIEGILMLIAGFVFLVSPDLRGLIYDKVHIYAFILGAFVFYYLLYLGKLVPRFISLWGLLGTATLALSTILKLFGQSLPVLDYFLILIITNEIFLAIWLMIKGFNLPADKSKSINKSK